MSFDGRDGGLSVEGRGGRHGRFRPHPPEKVGAVAWSSSNAFVFRVADCAEYDSFAGVSGVRV